MNHLTQCRIYTKFRSTPDLLAVVSDRIDRAFIRSGDARVVAFDISKACERVWLTDFLYKPKYYGISGWVFELTFWFFRNRWFRVVLDGKSASWCSSKLQSWSYTSSYTLMTFLMIISVILLSMLMILLSTLSVIKHLICGNNYDWLLNLNLIYETLWTGAGSGLLISVLKQLNLFHLIVRITTVLLLWKKDGSVLDEKSSFEVLALSSSEPVVHRRNLVSLRGWLYKVGWPRIRAGLVSGLTCFIGKLIGSLIFFQPANRTSLSSGLRAICDKSFL